MEGAHEGELAAHTIGGGDISGIGNAGCKVAEAIGVVVWNV